MFQFSTVNVTSTNNSVATVAEEQKPETTKTAKLLWKKKVKKRKSLESVSDVAMVFLYIKAWLKIGENHLQNEENVL